MVVALCCCIDFGTVLELRLDLQISEQLKYAAVDLTVVVGLLSFWEELGFNVHLLGWYFLREREREREMSFLLSECMQCMHLSDFNPEMVRASVSVL
jgi:hypothetical protein